MVTLLTALLLTGAATSPAGGGDAAPIELTRVTPASFAAAFSTMGTRAELTLEIADEQGARAAAEEARTELARIEALMSEWRPETPISKVNAAAGKEAVAVPAELYEVIARALELARLSDGAFDPSWAAMRGIWKFGDAQDGTVPDAAAIEAKRALVDYRKVTLDPKAHTVFLQRPGMALGLGGIAKGYAVDRVVALLRARGLTAFTVKVGGDLFAAGKKGGTAPWRVGVRDPRDAAKIFAVLELTDASFSTSGDYERSFVKDGIRYHHIIDPRTGRPATASRSVTARCPSAYLADSVTKPVFILGPERGIPFAERLGCDVLVVDQANQVRVSKGLSTLTYSVPTP